MTHLRVLTYVNLMRGSRKDNELTLHGSNVAALDIVIKLGDLFLQLVHGDFVILCCVNFSKC